MKDALSVSERTWRRQRRKNVHQWRGLKVTTVAKHRFLFGHSPEKEAFEKLVRKTYNPNEIVTKYMYMYETNTGLYRYTKLFGVCVR
jgi:homogentisate 1,2-dioxygenase